VKIIDVDRWAGMSTCKKPPRRLLGRTGTVRRPLIGWNGYWVSFGRAKKVENCGSRQMRYPDEHVFAAEELKVVRRAH